VQTPLSDDSGSDFAELLDTSFAELRAGSLEDSATFSEDELGTFLAELELTFAELELCTTFAELDEASELELDSKLNGDGSSLTKYGELSESPHAQSISVLAKTAAEARQKTNLREFIKFQPRRNSSYTEHRSLSSPKCPQHTLNIHQKTQLVKLRLLI
jgi:hypothetical protein